MDDLKVDQVMDLRSKLLDNILIGDKQGKGELLMRASASYGVCIQNTYFGSRNQSVMRVLKPYISDRALDS